MADNDFVIDIYPAADPAGKISGTGETARLARMSLGDQLRDAEFLTELRGMGSGFLEIHADHPDVQYLERHGYAQLVQLLPFSDEQKVAGFWLERGELKTLSAKEGGGRVLRIEGEGPIFILSRYVLGHSVYASGQTARGSAPNIEHQWTWRNEPLGGMLTRLIEEGADHPDGFYAAITQSFDRNDDSNTNPWTDIESYDTKIGTNGLQMYADLQQLGLVAWMDADLELHAYRDLSEWRVDRTSATFAADKVRFEAGKNIGSEMPKRIWATNERTHVLIKDRIGEYQTVDEDLDGNPLPSVPWMTYLESRTTADDAAIVQMGKLHLTRRAQEADHAKIKHLIARPGGASGANGYTPGNIASSLFAIADYWIGDLVTVHTGTSDYDYNEQPIEVAAIRWLVQGNDWIAELEVGATYLRPDQDKLDRAISTTIQQVIKSDDRPKLYIVIGDGSAVISTGQKPAIPIRDAVTIIGWTALSADGTSGSIVVDLWVGPYSDFFSSITNSDSITNGAEIAISSSTKNQDSDVTNWTTGSGAEIPANSVLIPNVDSVTSIKILIIELWLKK